MDYPCAKFGDFGLRRFGQTHRHADRITEADDRYTDMSTVAASRRCLEFF